MTPGNYIWHTKYHDAPVTVLRTLGKGPDGRTYVQIQGTTTGVPADELSYVPPRRYSLKDRLKQLLGL